jgi:autotransporter-associated beta strand protein
LGGAVFVRDGGTLIIKNGGFAGNYSVTGGAAGGTGAGAGQAHGSVMFVEGGTTAFDIGAGRVQIIGDADAITGSGTLAKTGTGTLILSGTNGFTGATIVDTGLLRVDGELTGSAITIGNSGILGGTGTVGAATISGTLAPGASTGILSTGNVVLTASASLAIELGGTLLGAAGYDQLDITGAISLGGATLDLKARQRLQAVDRQHFPHRRQ